MKRLRQPLAALASDQPHTVDTARCILIVEDDILCARMIREALWMEGNPNWDIQIAYDGESALALAAAHLPHVILLDVLLPTLDGTEVYRRLRASQLTRQTPVLFVTAISVHDLHLRGIADGVLLRKPFDVAELVQRVHSLLSK